MSSLPSSLKSWSLLDDFSYRSYYIPLTFFPSVLLSFGGRLGGGLSGKEECKGRCNTITVHNVPDIGLLWIYVMVQCCLFWTLTITVHGADNNRGDYNNIYMLFLRITGRQTVLCTQDELFPSPAPWALLRTCLQGISTAIQYREVLLQLFTACFCCYTLNAMVSGAKQLKG